MNGSTSTGKGAHGHAGTHDGQEISTMNAFFILFIDLIDKLGQRRIGKSVLMPAAPANPVLFVCLPAMGGQPLLLMRSERPGSCVTELYSENGAVLRKKELVYNAGENRWPMERQGLRPGTYFLTIRFREGSVQTLRIVWPK